MTHRCLYILCFHKKREGNEKHEIRSPDNFQAKPEPMTQRQTSLVQQPEGKWPPVASQIHPIPEVKGPYDVLIRTCAVALNPTDYKMPSYHPVPGAILGCDFMGAVISAGPEVNNAPPGTRLCGPIYGSNPGNPASGAFTEYLVQDVRLCLRVPDTWSDLEGAALGGIGWATVGLAMEHSLGLTGLPSKPASLRPDGTRVPVLVYGGATATGTMACQILAMCVSAQ